jgi:hypothetical protein
MHFGLQGRYSSTNGKGEGGELSEKSRSNKFKIQRFMYEPEYPSVYSS